MMLKSHIEIDLLKFERINKDIGRHDSEINDLKSEKMAAVAETFRHLLDSRA